MNADGLEIGQIDLTNCDSEPIHIPGSIQPHGVLVTVRESDLTIAQVSANTAEHFGMTPESLLGQPLGHLIGRDRVERLKTEVMPQDLDDMPRYLPAINVGTEGTIFERIIHRSQGQLIMEFEPMVPISETHLELYTSLKSAIARLERKKGVCKFCQAVAEEVRIFTGFDRVMVYRFFEDGAGSVIGEAIGDGLIPYLGLHFPGSDIPQQARALYMKNWLRFKVDVADISAPMIPLLNPVTNAPLDMSYSALRAMSPIHTEYLRNMGARSTMSLSIMRGGKLWGLIACHHHSGPKYVRHDQRMACEFLAHMLSLPVSINEDAEIQEYVDHLHIKHKILVAAVSSADSVAAGLMAKESKFGRWLDSAGVAIFVDGEVNMIGITPSDQVIRRLAVWLDQNVADDVYSTNALSLDASEFADCTETAAGLMAARIGQPNPHPQYLLWFQPEIAQSVYWAGNPNKPVEMSGINEQLTPRKSFELWIEDVKGKSEPWKTCEIEAVRKFGHSIRDIGVRKAEQSFRLENPARLASLNTGGNQNGNVDQERSSKEDTMDRLTQRAASLIDSLLLYNLPGNQELMPEETDLEKVLDETLGVLSKQISDRAVEIRRTHQLPKINADPLTAGEVFTNLISNAIKYNDKPQPWVEIGWTAGEDEAVAPSSSSATIIPQIAAPIFHVRDNGIGLPPQHHATIFRLFRRLQGPDEYGGGTGAGLTIARKIIEQSGGDI